MFRTKYKRGEHHAVRLTYKKLQDSNSVIKAMEWLRRNYPEAFKGDEK